MQTYESYFLFGGLVRSISTTLGINQNPTVVTVSVVKDSGSISVTNRELINISLGEFDFTGIVQSWSEAKTDVAGTGVYQIRITDTKIVLNAAQVIIGSSFDDASSLSSVVTQPENYGNNVITVLPKSASEIINGVPFNNIKTSVQGAQIRYGNLEYRVSFDFTLPSRGSSVTYSIKGKALSLLELISQIANDHGLDWYVTTSMSKVISVKMFDRNNSIGPTVDQLVQSHEDAIIRRHEGEENRDAVQKVVLIGGYRTYISVLNSSDLIPFWGFDDNGDKRSEPVFTTDVMETVINNNFTSEDYTEDDVQKILSYANEFWGRKFVVTLGSQTRGADGRTWQTPTSAAWWRSTGFPANLDADGQFKFQTEDGRWVTFVTLPLPGERRVLGGTSGPTVDDVNFQWEDDLFSNPNTYINSDNVIHMKASLEIVNNTFMIVTLSTPLRVKATHNIVDFAGDVRTDYQLINKSRLASLDKAYVAILDQRFTYGPWTNRFSSVGRTEVIIDSSLTPWSFGYRGITDSIGFDLMTQVALAKIKTVADTVMDSKTVELEVAGFPAVNIGSQLQTTGAITSINVVFSTKGVRTTYKSLQYTTELSKHLRQQQDLLDSLRRRASAFNTLTPPKDDWALDTTIKTLKKELPEPDVSSEDEGISSRRELKTVLGRIEARSSTTEPKYNITPMAWTSDVFGELTLVRDPLVFGSYLRVVNMGERQTAPGRLSIGKDVRVHEFSVTDGGIISYYIDISVTKISNFTATIIGSVSNSQPFYKVAPVVNAVQQVNLTSNELLSLNNVLNIGETPNSPGFLPTGTQVMVLWNENTDGSNTPFIEQQLNIFKPIE